MQWQQESQQPTKTHSSKWQNWSRNRRQNFLHQWSTTAGTDTLMVWLPPSTSGVSVSGPMGGYCFLPQWGWGWNSAGKLSKAKGSVPPLYKISFSDNSEEKNITIRPHPQKRFWAPSIWLPAMISLRGSGRQPDQPRFRRPSNVALDGALWVYVVRFPLLPRNHVICFTLQVSSGISKRGLSKQGLGPKGANWAQKGPFGAIPWLWGGGIGPDQPRKGPDRPWKGPNLPRKARFPRKDSPPNFQRKFGA